MDSLHDLAGHDEQGRGGEHGSHQDPHAEPLPQQNLLMPARLVEQPAEAANGLTRPSQFPEQSRNHEPGSGNARSVAAANADADAGENAGSSNCSVGACSGMLQGAAWLTDTDAEEWTVICVRSQALACHQGRVQPNMEPHGRSFSTAVISIRGGCSACPVAL